MNLNEEITRIKSLMMENDALQGMMKKRGYQKHQTNGIKDLLYFEI
jgi:hypothetical protein